MKKSIIEAKVISNNQIASDIYELVLYHSSFNSKDFACGQFLNVKCSINTESFNYPLLRRPISICDVNNQAHTLTMLYRAEGQGTSLLAKKTPGEEVNLFGSLGSGFNLKQDFNSKKILLIGGGIGVPPMYYLAKELSKLEALVTIVNGFADRNVCFYEQEFNNLNLRELFYVTVDGDYQDLQGRQEKGFVTDIIDRYQLEDYDYLYACGPNLMLKALQKKFDGRSNSFISVEERMGCGIGACLACVCDYQQAGEHEKDYARACKEGPVFNLNEIILR